MLKPTRSIESDKALPPKRPQLAELTEALKPVLDAGLPITNLEIASSRPLALLLGWQRESEYRKNCNDLLRSLLQDFADDDLADAARALFGDYKPSSKDINVRRQTAAQAMHLDPPIFQRDVEPAILSTLSYQILRSRWPTSDQQPDNDSRDVASKMIYVAVIALLVLSGLTSWAMSYRIAAGSLAAICAGAALLATRYRRRDRERRKRQRTRSPYPDAAFLARIQREGTERLSNSKESIPLLVEMILSPSQFRMRTVESISLEGRSIKQRVAIDFSFSDLRELLPQSPDQTSGGERGMIATATELESQERPAPPEVEPPPPQFLYVPLLTPRKGDLMDRFEITRSDGRSAISLSYKQSLRVLSVGLRYLIVTALAELGSRSPDLDNSIFEQASLTLLRLVGRRGSIDRASPEWKSIESTVDSTLMLIADLFPGTEGAEYAREDLHSRRAAAFSQVRNYVLMLTHSYPIIVSLPNTDPQPRRRLQFQRVIVSPTKGTSRFRLWLGLRPNDVSIPINLAFETDSHHLEVVGPPEYYVSHQFAGCTRCKRRIRSDWRGIRLDPESCNHAPIGLDDQSYVRVSSRVGQNYSHLYMRGFASSRIDYRNIVARVRFAEAPPGVEERALLSAFTASVVFGVLGYILSLRVRHASPIPTDVPMLFLAVPGLAAAWFGLSSDADTVLRTSLTARFSLVVTAILSLAGVSCYLLQHYLRWNAGPDWSFLGIDQYVWLSLLGLSLINLAVVGYKTAYRMLHFIWLSTKDDSGAPESSTEEEGREVLQAQTS